jgi:hypothetical protein
MKKRACKGKAGFCGMADRASTAPLLEENRPRFDCDGHRKAGFGSILLAFGQYFPVPPLRSVRHGQHYWQTTGTDPGDRIRGMTSMRTSRPFLQYGHRCTSKLQMRFNRSSVVSCGFMIILSASFTRSLQNLVL